MSYTLVILSDAYHYPNGRGRSYVPKYILSKDSCTPCTCFHSLTCITYKHAIYIRCHYKISIIGFQTYSKHIPSRRYVHPVHPSEEPCASSTYFHHIICVTYKHAIYMRFHHKNNFNHRFSNLFQAHSSEKLCIQVHPFEEPCTTSTGFHHKNLIIYFQIYFMPG